MKIQLAHSPDADDAFMFYALFAGKIDRGGFEIEEVREDIQSLNRKALEGAYEVSAVSFHVVPQIAERYRLLPAGACFGENYGPVVVSLKPLKPSQVLKVLLGVPGKQTTAFLILKLWEHHVAALGKSGICFKEVPFDQIMEQVVAAKLDAGLLIHEGQLNFAEKGLHKVVDLGEWWHKETSLPLPLGGIVVRRDLEEETQKQVADLIRRSIQYALDHKEEALAAALPYARGLDPERAARFIDMYVNALTVDMGRKGTKSLRVLFDRAFQRGLLDHPFNFNDLIVGQKRKAAIDEASTEPPPAEETT